MRIDLPGSGTFRLVSAIQGSLDMIRDMSIRITGIWDVLDFGVTIRVDRDIPSLGEPS
jgi:hypothetical protein